MPNDVLFGIILANVKVYYRINFENNRNSEEEKLLFSFLKVTWNGMLQLSIKIVARQQYRNLFRKFDLSQIGFRSCNML